MSRELDDLSPRIFRQACEFIARAAAAGIPLLLLDTLRTLAEQKALYAKGRTAPGAIVTWTMESKHLPQSPDGKSLAFDVVPFEIFQLHGPDKLNWNTADPVWQKLGAIGEKLGLKWGVVDSKGNQKDHGHFEFKAVAGPVPKSDGSVV